MKKRKQERENYNKNKQEKRTTNQECTNIRRQKNNSKKQIQHVVRQQIENEVKYQKGITLLALVITIVLNCSYLAMDQMNKIEKI